MQKSVKLNQREATNQKYFNSQKRLVSLLRKNPYVYREELETVKNIGQIPWTFMINCLTAKQVDDTPGQGRNKIKYCWNGTTPSVKITEGMIRAMRANKKDQTVKQPEIKKPTSMKEVAIEEQQASYHLNSFLEVEHMILDLHDRITALEDSPIEIDSLRNTANANTLNITDLWQFAYELETTIEDNDKTKPSLLSRIKFPVQRFWNEKSSFRYFVYYSLAWITISSAVLIYFNRL